MIPQRRFLSDLYKSDEVKVDTLSLKGLFTQITTVPSHVDSFSFICPGFEILVIFHGMKAVEVSEALKIYKVY